MPAAGLSRRAVLGLILALALVWFGTLDARRLLNPDEARYAEIAREMVASGDWLTPRLNGLKYFEKPALHYWMTAAAYSAFGEHHWTARLWTALTGFAGILITGFAGARLFGAAAGLLGAAVLASSVLWNLVGHVNTLDMSVSVFLAAAVFAVCLAEHAATPPAESRRWRYGAWALLGLAILSKGLIGALLPAVALMLYALWQRDPGLLLRLAPVRGMLILLAVTAPWFVAVSLANPEFAHFFFIHEHVERFLTTVHRRYQPAWYFIPILAAGLLPWTASILAALRGSMKQSEQRFHPQRFLLVWILVVFSFFSASSSKLPAYIVPLFPALALLIGQALAKCLDSPAALRRHLLLPAILGAAALGLAGETSRFAGDNAKSIADYAAYAGWLQAAAACLLLGALAALWLIRRHALAAVLLTAAGAHLAGQLILLGHDRISDHKTAHAMAMQLRDRLPPDVPLYSVATYDQSLPFYLRRTLTLVAYRDEMDFGIRQEPDKFIPDLASFERVWRTAPEAFALMSPDTHARLSSQGLPMTDVLRDAHRVIVKTPVRQP